MLQVQGYAYTAKKLFALSIGLDSVIQVYAGECTPSVDRALFIYSFESFPSD